MSLSSITHPPASASPANQNPFSAASALGSGSFTSLLMQALQSGNTTAASSAAGATSGSASASGPAGLAGAVGAHGHHHGHHGGGHISVQQLLSMLQQINASGTGGATASTGLPAATSGTSAAGVTTAGTAAAPITLPALLQNLRAGSLASHGVGRLLNIAA